MLHSVVQLGQLRGALLIQAAHHLLAQRHELGALALGNGVRSWQLDAERIHMATVDLELIMQVRAGGQSGRADITDNLALGDVAACANAVGVSAHVCIKSLIGLAVLDNHRVAIAALAPDVYYAAIAGCLDRSAGGCSIIHAFVGANLVQYRVSAAGIEARADAGELNRRTDDGLSHAGAIGAIVTAVAAAVGIAHGSKGAAAVGEAGCEDAAGANALTIDVLFFKQHFKIITLTNFAG